MKWTRLRVRRYVTWFQYSNWISHVNTNWNTIHFRLKLNPNSCKHSVINAGLISPVLFLAFCFSSLVIISDIVMQASRIILTSSWAILAVMIWIKYDTLLLTQSPRLLCISLNFKNVFEHTSLKHYFRYAETIDNTWRNQNLFDVFEHNF